MTSSQQEMLRKAWLEGRHGNLCALSEAMLWAVREVWRAEKRSLHGLHTFAAGLVTKPNHIGLRLHRHRLRRRRSRLHRVVVSVAIVVRIVIVIVANISTTSL